jgi:hypothetical protein
MASQSAVFANMSERLSFKNKLPAILFYGDGMAGATFSTFNWQENEENRVVRGVMFGTAQQVSSG